MAAPVPSTDDYGRSQIAAAREREQSLREDALLRWCESFGVVRRFERRENGDIHVYWKEWEVADTVSLLFIFKLLSIVLWSYDDQRYSLRDAEFVFLLLSRSAASAPTLTSGVSGGLVYRGGT